MDEELEAQPDEQKEGYRDGEKLREQETIVAEAGRGKSLQVAECVGEGGRKGFLWHLHCKL